MLSKCHLGSTLNPYDALVYVNFTHNIVTKTMCKKWPLHGDHTPPSNLTRSEMNRDEDICPMKMKQHGLD
jgi:hypothetical protein